MFMINEFLEKFLNMNRIKREGRLLRACFDY